MYKLYGEHACTACLVAQNRLKANKVEFTYQHLDELPEEEKELLVAKAVEQNKVKMPLIVKDDKFYFLEEII
jgi:glutaredoxin